MFFSLGKSAGRIVFRVGAFQEHPDDGKGKIKMLDQRQMQKLKDHQEKVALEHSRVDLPVTMTTETYSNRDAVLEMDIWHPNPQDFPGLRPGILLFFGGGFILGTRKSFQKHCEALARQGYVAITSDYRITSLHGTSAEESCLDGAEAWRYVLANGDRWSMDRTHVALGGQSAGGMVAVMCGRLTGIQPLGYVLFNPGILNHEMGPERLSRLTGKEVEGIPMLHTRHAKTGDPPVLVMHGGKDTTVPVEHAQAYVADAQEKGVDATLILYPEATHGLGEYNNDRAYYFLCLGETLRFLERINS